MKILSMKILQEEILVRFMFTVDASLWHLPASFRAMKDILVGGCTPLQFK